jgi:hypothetical protein
MDIEVNKEQLHRVVIKWLNKYFGDLRPVEYNTYPESLFYVNPNNKVIMEWVPEYDDVWVDSEDIWLKMESIFDLNDMDTQSIMEIWLRDTYGLKNVSPHSDSGWYEYRWKMITDTLNQKNNK